MRALTDALPKIPLLFCAVMTAVLWLVGENYPFSNFPMYSNFQPETDYLWISDGNDQPLAVQKVFGHRTSTLKKVFGRNIKSTRDDVKQRTGRGVKLEELPPEAWEAAGVETLRWMCLSTRNAALPPVIRLHRVELRLKDEEILPTSHRVAELRQ